VTRIIWSSSPTSFWIVLTQCPHEMLGTLNVFWFMVKSSFVIYHLFCLIISVLFQLSKSAPVEPAIIILATDEHGKTQIKKEEFP
jgi:hypothetical protein